MLLGGGGGMLLGYGSDMFLGGGGGGGGGMLVYTDGWDGCGSFGSILFDPGWTFIVGATDELFILPRSSKPVLTNLDPCCEFWKHETKTLSHQIPLHWIKLKHINGKMQKKDEIGDYCP